MFKRIHSRRRPNLNQPLEQEIAPIRHANQLGQLAHSKHLLRDVGLPWDIARPPQRY